jgi:FecR protein
MREIKVWPHLTIIAVVCAVAAGVGVGLWMKRNQTASAESVLTAGRIQRVDGDVSVSALTNNASEQLQWSDAAANTPFSVGDRIYTNDNSQASLAFSGRNFARLQPNTSLDVLSLDRRRTQLALRDGSAMFDVGYLEPGQVFEVGTPYGAVDFNQPGLYDVGIGDNGSVIVSALSGLAQVVGLGGTGQISKGEMLTLLGQTAAEIALSRINGRDAGYLVDDYYRYQYPQYYDGRYSDYNTYVNDPYYFDPYRRNVSYQYASPYIPGLNDLDYYGDWQNVNGYGNAWTPRVSSGWSPYQQGYWINDYPYGPTWVSTEPWGYAPYHYGRWASVGDRWYWIPDGVNTTPTYSPALVGFIPNQNEIGWVPLAPGDPYVARYYDDGWNPYYLSRQDLYQQHLVNLGVPGAVAVLPLDDFVRGYDDHRIRRWDRRDFDGTRAVLDPLLMTPLRNAVIHSAWGFRGKKDLPPGIAKKLLDRQVIVSNTPLDLPFRRDFARRFGVSTVPDRAKGQRFKVKDERPDKQTSQFVRDDGRDLNSSGNHDRIDKSNKHELKQIERQQRSEARQFGRVEGDRVAAPAIDRGRGRGAEQKQKHQVQDVRKAQPEMRRIDPSPARPNKHQEKPNMSAQPVKQSAPAVQQGGGHGHGAVKSEKQGGGHKNGGPPAAQGGGGGGKGKGKGKG